MGFSRADYEAGLQEIEELRHLTRTGLLNKWINGWQFKDVMDTLDKREKSLLGRLWGTAQVMKSIEHAQAEQAGGPYSAYLEREREREFKEGAQTSPSYEAPEATPIGSRLRFVGGDSDN